MLLGAVGGPKWDTTDPHKPRPEQGLLGMRKGLGAVRQPAAGQSFPALADNSTLKPEVHRRRRHLVVRELTGGIYFGERERIAPTRAYDTMLYSRGRGRARSSTTPSSSAAGAGAGLVHSVDKANVLEIVAPLARGRRCAVGASAIPDVELRHMLVDNSRHAAHPRPAGSST